MRAWNLFDLRKSGAPIGKGEPVLVRRAAANAGVRAGVKPMTVPSFDDLISGKVAVAALREV